MAEYVKTSFTEDYVSVTLYVEDPAVMRAGEKIRAAVPKAYMNGYGWEALINC